MSFDPAELRNLARHERDVLTSYRDLVGTEEEVLVQPSSGGGDGSQIRLARLYGFHYEPIGGGYYIALYFWGLFINSIAQNNPDPMPEFTAIWARRYPIISLGHDLTKVVPAIPFQENTEPGHEDMAYGLADVLVMWIADSRVPAEEGGGRWCLVNDSIGVCV